MNDQPVIVCGTDFSAAAGEAAHIAGALARRLGGKVLLLHVVERSGMTTESPEIDRAYIGAEGEELRAAAETLRLSGAEVEEGIAFGAPHQALATAAAARQARLVVVAAIGRSVRLMMGSVAQRTAETAAVPTLVVRHGRRIAEWARSGTPLRILVGYDLSATGDAALRSVKELMDLAPCEVTVLHVYWPPEVRRRLDIHGPVSLVEGDEATQEALERQLAEKASVVFGANKVTLRVQPGWGRIDSDLVLVARETAADLLVLGSHQRHGLERFRLGSVSRAAISGASLSVLIVPKPAEAAPVG